MTVIHQMIKKTKENKMKTIEEILIEQNRQIIDLLTEIKETNRQLRNHHIYHGPKQVYVVDQPTVDNDWLKNTLKKQQKVDK